MTYRIYFFPLVLAVFLLLITLLVCLGIFVKQHHRGETAREMQLASQKKKKKKKKIQEKIE